MAYKDKSRQREYQKIWQRNNRESFFVNKVCVKCGSSVNLELHHINPETKITHRIWSWSLIRRIEELSKCVVLCKKCHRLETNVQHTVNIHGTLAMYNHHKCRCDKCKEARTQYARDHRKVHRR